MNRRLFGAFIAFEIAGLLATASAQATRGSCPTKTADSAKSGLCIYDASIGRRFIKLSVLIDGNHAGYIPTDSRFIYIELPAGTHIVGLDRRSAAKGRLRVTVGAGDVIFVRNEDKFTSRNQGFFDSTTTVADEFRLAAADEFAADLRRLNGGG